jgi:hypothetical protein
MIELICHGVGDYMLQSDWMASKKTSSWWPAIAHALSYTLPFLILTRSPAALAFILLTHLIIDHYRLARYICWVKNWLAPRWLVCGVLQAPDGKEEYIMARNYPWSECTATGYGPDKAPWLAVWLLIITDNVMHLACNAFALRWL